MPPTLLLLLTLLATMCNASSFDDKSIVIIDCFRSGRQVSQPIVGVALNANTVLTTHHGLAPALSAFVNQGEEGQAEIAEVLVADPLLDFALVKLEKPLKNAKGLELASKHPPEGADVEVYFRTPLGELKSRRCIIEQVSAVSFAETMVVSSRSSPGESGAAVIDTDGRLVAIAIRSGFTQADNTICLPAYRVSIEMALVGKSSGIPLREWHLQQSGLDPKAYWDACNDGQAALQRKDVKEAERLYRLALKANPKSFTALYGLHAALLFQGVSIKQVSETVDEFVIQSSGDKHLTWFGAYLRLVARKATPEDMEAIRVQLPMPEVQYWTATTLYNADSRNTDQPVRLLEEGRKKWPKFNMFLESLAFFRQAEQDIAAEIQCRTELVEQNPLSVSYISALLSCLQRANDERGSKLVIERLRSTNAYVANRLAREFGVHLE